MAGGSRYERSCSFDSALVDQHMALSCLRVRGVACLLQPTPLRRLETLSLIFCVKKRYHHGRFVRSFQWKGNSDCISMIMNNVMLVKSNYYVTVEVRRALVYSCWDHHSNLRVVAILMMASLYV